MRHTNRAAEKMQNVLKYLTIFFLQQLKEILADFIYDFVPVNMFEILGEVMTYDRFK